MQVIPVFCTKDQCLIGVFQQDQPAEFADMEEQRRLVASYIPLRERIIVYDEGIYCSCETPVVCGLAEFSAFLQQSEMHPRQVQALFLQAHQDIQEASGGRWAYEADTQAEEEVEKILQEGLAASISSPTTQSDLFVQIAASPDTLTIHFENQQQIQRPARQVAFFNPSHGPYPFTVPETIETLINTQQVTYIEIQRGGAA